MAKQITYREQEKIQNTMKLREFLSELPPYAKDYFRAKEPTTSDKTRLSYAYDLRVFFRFLQESNPNLKEKQISEISLSDLSALQPVDFEEFDMVVLPGGMPGTLNLKEHDGVRYVVKQYAKEGRFVGAICAAPTILKSLGLLEGRRATCYPGVEDEMENVILTETAVVVDDNIITSQGVGTAIDFALKLIEVLDGEEKAKEIAESIVF